MPIGRRGDLRQGIGVAVGGHLGHARGAGGEVHHQDVIVAGQLLRRGEILAGRVHQGGQVQPAGAVAQGDEVLEGAALGQSLLHMMAYLIQVHRHNGLDGRRLAAVDHVLLHQLGRGRDDNTPQLHQCQGAEPVFIPPLEHQHHRVALLQPQGAEHVGHAVAHAAHVPEGEALFLPCHVGPYHGGLVRGQAGVLVHNVVGEVEPGRDAQGIMLLKVLLGGKISADIAFSKHG